MTCIEYPLDVPGILRSRRALKRKLLERSDHLDLRVAVLGGSSTQEIVSNLEIFLLHRGIRPSFYESQYNRFYEDAVVDSGALVEFRPDIIYICTSSRNLSSWPGALAGAEEVERCLNAEIAVLRHVWTALLERLPASTLVQNNFEPWPLRPMGNLDGSAPYGRGEYIGQLNRALAAECSSNPRLRILDVHGLAEQVGMKRWFSADHWYNYKLAQSPEASVYLANSLSALIGSLYGRSKKCLILDLDNTLWGGVIGDDGVERIRLGRETGEAEAYSAFQSYCKELRKRGVLLAVCSKNEDAIARQGFGHPDSILGIPDFSCFKANWNPKHENIEEIARELNLGLDSFVFVDDNPAERALVKAQLPMVAVPEVGTEVSRYPEILDESGYFEANALSREDIERTALYTQNAARQDREKDFQNYGEYLDFLQMESVIGEFSPLYLDRIVQLTNKSNQFNLTTRRYTRAEIEAFAASPDWVTLYGRLKDRFGDNGLVSVVTGFVSEGALEIDLWLMSCRVLKRGLELAMLDKLVEAAERRGAHRLVGRYIRTAKNRMVADHYGNLGFSCVSRAEDGSESVWELPIGQGRYQARNRHIKEAAHEFTGTAA